jgi:hypothetical protein
MSLLDGDDSGPVDVGLGSGPTDLPDPDDPIVGPHVPDEWSSESSSRTSDVREVVDRLVDLLVAFRVPLSLVAIGTIVVVASGRAGLPEVPPWLSKVAKGVAVGAVPASIGTLALMKRYFPSNDVSVSVWDPRDGVLVDQWDVPTKTWDRRATGKYPVLEPDRGNVDAIVTRLAWVPFPDDDDRDADGKLVVEGVNPELSDPAEVMETEGMIRETYMDAQHKIAELKDLKATLIGKATDLRGDALMDVAESVEHGTSIHGSDPRERIDSDRWDLERERLESERSDDSEDDEQPSLADTIAAGREALRNDGGRSE